MLADGLGGQFSRSGGIEASALAQWDARGWSTVGGGVGFPGFLPFVRTLAVRGNDVFVGGRFTEVGGVSVSNVARWDGVGWHAAGAGTDGAISVLRALGPDLMAAGAFTTADLGYGGNLFYYLRSTSEVPETGVFWGVGVLLASWRWRRQVARRSLAVSVA